MSEGAGAALSATSGRGLLPLCGGVGPPGAGVFSSPQLQICGLSSVAVEGLGAVLRSISGVAEAVPKPLTRGESLLQPPRSATKSTGQSILAVSPLFGDRPSSACTRRHNRGMQAPALRTAAWRSSRRTDRCHATPLKPALNLSVHYATRPRRSPAARRRLDLLGLLLQL